MDLEAARRLIQAYEEQYGPFPDVLHTTASGSALAALSRAVRYCNTSTLKGIVMHPQFPRLIERYARPQQAAILRGVSEAIAAVVSSRDAVEVKPSEPAFPADYPPLVRSDVELWARERGLAPMLDRTLASLPGVPGGYTWLATREVFYPQRPGRFPQGEGNELLAFVRAHLYELAQRQAEARRQRDALRQDAELPASLRAWADNVSVFGELQWLPYPSSTVSFEMPPPTARVTLRRVTGETSEISFGLTGLARGDTRGRIERGGWGDPNRLISEATLVLADALREPDLPVGKVLREQLTAPAWRLAISAFQRTNEAARAEEGRLAFRVGDGHEVAVLAQRRLKSGSYGVGTTAAPALAHALAKTPLERQILSLLEVVRHRAGWAAEAPERLELFRALRDHPRVYFGASGAKPAHIVEASLTITLLDGAAGREVVARLDRLPAVPLAALPMGIGGEVVVSVPSLATVGFAQAGPLLMALRAALAQTGATFPAEADDALVGLLSELQSEVDVDLPEALAGDAREPAPQLVARASLSAGGDLDLTLLARPAPGSPLVVPGHGPPRSFFRDGNERVHAVRDLELELSLATPVWGLLPLPENAARGHFHAHVPAPLVLDVAAVLADHGVPIELPEGELPRSVGQLGKNKLRARITEAKNYFSLGGEVEIDEHTVELAELLAAVRAGRRFVTVAAGKFATLSRELRDDLTRLADVVDADGALTLAAMPVLESLLDEEQLKVAAGWRKMREGMQRARDLEVKVPAKLTAELRDYQRDGFVWMARLAEWGAGGCLADDMGLGKTVQTLALLLHRAKLGPALVVAPTSVVDNWVSEAARFAKPLKMVVFRGDRRAELLASLGPRSVAVMSYDVVLRDVDALRQVKFATLILDEAQAIKNPESKRARAVSRLDADVRFALSGTPVENHLGELWSLFHAVLPGLFGAMERFRARFAIPIERHRDPARQAVLAELLRPFLLRRTKELVAPELPPRTETVRHVELGPRERARYEVERRRAIAELSALDPAKGQIQMLATLTRLRRLACDVRLVDATADGEGSKLASTLELLDEILDSGHTALVFSQFTTHLALVRAELDRRRVGYAYLDGQTPAEQRTKEVKRFQASEVRLFLLSLKAGGTGLNLTAADYVLHLDPWWNPAAEDQATDRAHRIGQDKPVTVVRLVTKGTIEEAVLSLHDEKRALAQAVLQGGDVAARLSASELIDLVRSDN